MSGGEGAVRIAIEEAEAVRKQARPKDEQIKQPSNREVIRRGSLFERRKPERNETSLGLRPHVENT